MTETPKNTSHTTAGDNHRTTAPLGAGATKESASKKMSKKARRRQRQRKQLLAMASLLLVVVVIIGGVILYNKWAEQRIETLPQDQRITAVVDGREIAVPPYSACEIGSTECNPGEPFELKVGDAKEFTLKIPQDVADHDWSMLKVYPDPGANTEDYFKSNEVTELKIQTKAEKASSDGSHSPLQVVEIHSMLIGKGAEGDQAPYATIWSLAVRR